MRFFLLSFFLALSLASVMVLGTLEYWSDRSGVGQSEQVFVVERGENAWVVATHLEEKNLVRERFGFLYALARLKKLDGGLVAGKYLLSPSLSAREMALRLTSGQPLSQDVQVTFPEGFTAMQMAERLSAAGLPGDAFLSLALKPLPEWREEFSFLASASPAASLEGFLFPDTYRFDRQASAESIIRTLLQTFEKKAWPLLKSKTVYTYTPYDILILSSIVETEVQSDRDRALVADLFLRRLAVNHALQSDATVKYILGFSKVQHSYAETRVDSPYNTYVNTGLPPGPIANPGVSALRSTLSPSPHTAFYFLSDPATGETIFSDTFEEHVRNKAAHGL